MAKYVVEHKEDGKFWLLTLEADNEIFKEEYDAHFNKALRKITVPGFRKGHAPKEMAVQYLKNRGRFLGELEHVVNKVIERTVLKMSEVDKEWDEKIFGFPVSNQVKEFNLDKWSLQFEAKFEKFPVVELADYSKIETLIEHKVPNLELCPVPEDKEVEAGDFVAIAMLGKDSKGHAVSKYVYDMLEVDLENTKINKKIVDAIIGSKAKDKKEVKLKDNNEEISLEIWIIEVRRKTKIDQELIEKLKFPEGTTVDTIKEMIEKQHKVHNSYVRYQDILKWLNSNSNKVEPFPLENLRRETSKAFHHLQQKGNKNVNFENLLYEQGKNLKVTLVLDAIAKREGITVQDGDKEDFAKNIEENPWIYGNRKVEDVFNCDDELLQEYILQFKTIKLLIDRWIFSS